MPSILFLEQYANISGGQRVLLSLLDGLRPEFRCSVVVPGRGPLTDELARRGIGYHVVPVGYYSLGEKGVGDIARYLARLPYLILKLRMILRQVKPDVVYANAGRTFPWATIACSAMEIPLVWHVHSIFDKGLTRFLCLYFGRSPWVKKIIAVSSAAQEPLADLADKTEIIYNAVDTAVYHPGSRQGPVRAELALGKGPVIAMVGLLVAWKGVDDYLRAMARVRQRFPQAQGIIVGDVLHEHSGRAYKQYLQRLVQELGLEKEIIFTGFRNDVPDILREIDVLVLASKQPDPCPTVVLQAMACGAAVIATDFGGPAEIIADGEDGLLYPAGDIDVLTRRIEFLLERPGERDRIGAAAARKMRESFPLDEYVQKIHAVIVQARGHDNESRYCSGEYGRHNPTWHAEDASWKAAKICEALSDDFLRTLPATVRLVDIGCGVGEILKRVSAYLEARGKIVQAEGYDLSPEALAQARQRFPQAVFHCQAFDSSAHDQAGGRIIIALLIDILEHVDQPEVLLRKVRDVADHVVCHVPLEDNLQVNMRGLRRRFSRTVGHVHFYNEASARDLFARNGFSIVTLCMTCSDCSADYRLASPLRRIILQPLRKLFFRRLPQFTARVLGNCSFLRVARAEGEGRPW